MGLRSAIRQTTRSSISATAPCLCPKPSAPGRLKTALYVQKTVLYTPVIWTTAPSGSRT